MQSSPFEDVFAGAAPVVLLDEPLSKHTTWRIGGPADVLVIPHTVAQVQEVVARAVRHGIPWFVLGRGSNLLVRDGGLRGLVIKLGDDFSAVSVEDGKLTALSGRGMVSAANIAIRQGLSGLEFATGIPGTVGGAVTMNAGAHGSEIKDVLAYASVLDASGAVREVDPAELSFRYRHSAVRERGWIVIAATFALQPGDVTVMQEQTRAHSRRRQSTQPLSLPNCGSVFRNPEGDYAARLIEAADLKGFRVGNAAVSDLHANFIVNLGGASASDVQAVMATVQRVVGERFGVELVPEVRVVGEDLARRC